MISGSRLSGTATPLNPPRGAETTPLPWPAAMLTIGTLSAGLWLGIGWLVTTLF